MSSTIRGDRELCEGGGVLRSVELSCLGILEFIDEIEVGLYVVECRGLHEDVGTAPERVG